MSDIEITKESSVKYKCPICQRLYNTELEAQSEHEKRRGTLLDVLGRTTQILSYYNGNQRENIQTLHDIVSKALKEAK